MNTNQIFLPKDYINCPRDDLVVLISRMLNSIIQMNDRQEELDLDNDDLTRFHSRTPPGISVYSYLMRLSRYSSLENAVLLAAVYYIDSISQAYTNFSLNSLTVHRYLLTATTVGSKGLCDSFCTNYHYARVGGIQPAELEILEREFLVRLKYLILPKNTMASANQETEQGAEGQDQGPNRRSRSITSIPNSSGISKYDGFAVLDIYYRKMIELVGSNLSVDSVDTPDPSQYLLTPDGKDELYLSHTNTLPDTMSDFEFSKYLHNLRLQLKLTDQSQFNGNTHEQRPILIPTENQDEPLTSVEPAEVQGAQVRSSSSPDDVDDTPEIKTDTDDQQQQQAMNQETSRADNVSDKPTIEKSPLKRSIEEVANPGTRYIVQNGDGEKKIRRRIQEDHCDPKSA
ncbi:hypothetical protein WICPIJ_002152 [Wickerhamomyces pijperi]|uniref:Cyclin-like domain-containing protein n=1 Tax=Wickerhamomyces pijperi TaxID=599730 RepID=A0A9P8TP78_WICPI|nr:hypothetical protein WICPIJ_002152 [Wickerhamomyces pijperi]